MSETAIYRGGPELPRCQVPLVHADGEPPQAAVDGKTRQGPWAYMCEECFARYGVGLGTGRGQRLVPEEPT